MTLRIHRNVRSFSCHHHHHHHYHHCYCYCLCSYCGEQQRCSIIQYTHTRAHARARARVHTHIYIYIYIYGTQQGYLYALNGSYIQREKKISPRIWYVNLILWWLFFTSDKHSLNKQLEIKSHSNQRRHQKHLIIQRQLISYEHRYRVHPLLKPQATVKAACM